LNGSAPEGAPNYMSIKNKEEILQDILVKHGTLLEDTEALGFQA